jgi:hypothetical protein
VVKTFFSSALAVIIVTSASAQVVPSVQESGDIYADIVRLNQSNGYTTLSSPFNMGFVNTPTNPILPVAFTNSVAGVENLSDIFFSLEGGYNGFPSQSAIGVSFGGSLGLGSYFIIPYGITMFATDVIPCIETKIPKGTYTFQATATPNPWSGSAPGTFEFATQTAGIWTVQFNLALPKAEGATRTLTFAHDTRVRWMLINQPGQSASATITAKYYNSGS